AGEPDRPQVGRRMADAGARLARAAPRAASLFLEEREVGAGVRATRGRPAGILGAERLSHAGRPVDGGAVRRSRADAARDQYIPECIDLVLRQPATAEPLLRPRVAPHVIAVLLPESRQVFLE